MTSAINLHGCVRYTATDIDHDGCTRFDAGGAEGFTALETVLHSVVFGSTANVVPIVAGACGTFGPDLTPLYFRQKLDEHNVSWRIGADWTPIARTLLYASISKGYKAGNFPTLAAASYLAERPVTQELVLAYELGIKARLLDNRLHLDASVFYYDYKNKQLEMREPDPVGVFGLLNTLVNIPRPKEYRAMKLTSELAAVVTGGASGLGAATARALASRGVRVGIFDVDTERGQALAGEIGGVFAWVDLTADDDIARGFETLRILHGQERVLINCAGTGDAIKTAGRDKDTGQIAAYPMANFVRTIDVNLIGTFRCIAASAAGMMTLTADDDGERGVIINTASVSAQDGQMGQSAYAASKAGVVGMTLPIARDLMGEGIRVNTIMPGLFDTPLLATVPEKVRNALAGSVPFPNGWVLPTSSPGWPSR